MKLASRLAQIKPSATLAITSRIKEMRAEGVDVVGLGAGEPDFPTPAIICRAAEKAIADRRTQYTPASGIPELRKAVCDRFAKDNGLRYDPAQIIVSSGAKHSIFNAVFALCEPGDEVLIPAPYWLSYPEIVRLTGAEPVVLETQEAQDFKLDPANLRKAIGPKTKLLILNSPSNPTGVVYSQAELDAIAKVVLDTKIMVLSDEIYNEYLFHGEKFASIARSDAKIVDQLILVNGVSKTYSMTGWRIGYLAAPLALAKAISGIQSHTTSNPSSIAQYAALSALQDRIPELATLKETFAKRRDMVAGLLSKISGISFPMPQGAFYFFVNISKTGMPADKVAADLLEKAHVGVIPGEPFGAPNHIRVSFATSEANLQKGLDRLATYFKETIGV